MVKPFQRTAMSTLSCILLTLVLTACTTVVTPPAEQDAAQRLVWPPLPAEPRIAFVSSFSSPDELGIRKSLFQRLGEFLGGASEVHLVRPMAIVVDPAGVIYVADPGVEGIHQFDKKAGRYRLIRGKKGRPLPSPVALAVGPAGEVYVSDSRLSAVFVIEPGATEALLVPLKALIAQPTGIALDPGSGRLYLVDTGSHQVKVFARDGAFLKSFGQRGTGDGEFNFPTMIWRDDKGRLLIADSMNFRIQVFDESGRFLRKFGKVGDGTGQHAQPKGIAADSEGHIYVVDSLFHTLQLFDPQGRFLLNVGRQGKARGEFWLPTGIFIGEQNTIYVADSYNGRVQIFRYVGAAP